MFKKINYRLSNSTFWVVITYCCWLQSIMTQSIGNIVGSLGLLYSHALDLVGCMQTISCFSKSISTKTYGYKNHIRIKIQRKSSYLDLDIPRSRTCLEKPESLSPHVVSHMWVSCDSCAHDLCMSHMLHVHIPCSSCAHGLCTSKYYSHLSKEVSYTQASTDDLNHDLGTLKCGLWK